MTVVPLPEDLKHDTRYSNMRYADKIFVYAINLFWHKH